MPETLPKNALADELEQLRKFLDGSGPLMGAHFGEARLTGAFWWRRYLDVMDLAAAALRASPGEREAAGEEAQVETVAKAIAEAEGAFGPLGYFPDNSPMRDGTWGDYDEDQREEWRKAARAAIRALNPPTEPVVDDGEAG